MTPPQHSVTRPVVRRIRPLAALVLVSILVLTGCGGSGGDASTGAVSSAATVPGGGSITAASLTPSFARAAVGFAGRTGSVLARSLDRSLGKGTAVAIKPGSAECRAAAATPSDNHPARFPFACIVSGIGAYGGVSTTFTLGFVVFNVKGHCWRAANERISAASAGPVLIPRSRALAPANVVAGCVKA